MKDKIAAFLRKLGPWLTHDYCNQIDPYLLDWAKSPLGICLLAALVAAFCGIFLHPHAFLLFFAIVMVTFLGLVWPWLSVRGLSGSMSFDRSRVREGDAVLARLTVRNRAPWGIWGLGIRIDCDDPQHTPADHGLVHVHGWRTAEGCWEYVPELRGEYPLCDPQINCGFPFGLWKAKRSLRIQGRLLVWPGTFPLGGIPQMAGDRHFEGMTFRNKAGTTGDILGVRPYRRGDPLRRVHWAQTARHDRLVVCELQSPAHPLAQIVVELDSAVHAGTGPESSREWAIRIAASFIESWLEEGAQVEVIFDEQHAVPGAVGPSHSGAGGAYKRRMLDCLARIPRAGGLSLSRLAKLPPWRSFLGGLRVIITTDRGLMRADSRVVRDRRNCFVVLEADAFAQGRLTRDGGREAGADCPSSFSSRPLLPVQPWIWVDDPTQVPGQVGAAWKEAINAS
jgi:uncharacterized protein (DUF58 family)